MKKRFIKKIIKVFMALFLSLSVLIGNVTMSYCSVQAAGVLPIVGKIAQYILSSVGAVNIATNGGVSRVSGSLYDGLVERINDAMGNGVYVDSSGNYVFSNEFSNNILSYLSGQNSINYRVISDFSVPSDYVGVWENSKYIKSDFISQYQTLKGLYNYYLLLETSYYAGGVWNSSITCFNMENVAYICNYSNTLSFYDKDLNRISVPSRCINQRYYTSDNSFSYVGIDNSNASNFWFRWWAGSRGGISSLRFYDNSYNYNNLISFPILNWYGNYDSTFSTYGGNVNVKFNVYSNRSIIVSNDSASANGVLNKSSGVFINNYSIPSISQNVVENNDWNSIYNNYVTNVSNNYTENNTNGEFNQTLLRKWMKNFSDNIITAIQNGDTNIAEQINYLNDWMKKIYDRLGMIYNLIDNMDFNVNSGSSATVSSTWTRQDIDDILGGLTRLENNMGYQLDEMENIYTVLTNFYNWAIAHPPNSGGGTPDINDNPYTPWADIIKNMPDTDFNGIISKWDVISTLLKDIYPFALFGTVTACLNAFSGQPVEPIFTIPLKVNNNYIDIDENVVIDFTVLNDLRNIVNALMMILGVVTLALFAWWVIPKLHEIIV